MCKQSIQGLPSLRGWPGVKASTSLAYEHSPSLEAAKISSFESANPLSDIWSALSRTTCLPLKAL